MNALILLLFAAADPTGLQAAFESAETVDLSFGWTGFKVTLVNPATIKKLAPLAEVRGKPMTIGNALPGTPDIIRGTIRGKKTTEFWMVRSNVAVGEVMFDTADSKLWIALRSYFQPPLDDPPKGGVPVDAEDSVQRTLYAAMKAADRLDVTYRRVQIKFPAGGDGIRNVHLKGLEITGDVDHNAKKPEDPVEIVFVSKETRIPIYLVGNTAYWGGGKHWRSVKLTRDSMWKQMVTNTPTPEDVGLKPEPDDASGLAAAIEASDSIVVTSVAGETENMKGTMTFKKDDFKGISVLGLGKPVSYRGKDDPDAIDIVVKKGKESRKYRLIADFLIFGDQSVKLENELLYVTILSKLQKTGR